MKIHKTVVDYAIRNKVGIGRQWQGYYYIGNNGFEYGFSLYPTAKSGIQLIKRYLKHFRK